MKNFKKGLTIIALSAGIIMFAQEKREPIGFGKDNKETVQKSKKAKVGFGKEVPKKETDVFRMPEKDDKQAKKWRKDGLKKNSKVKKNNKLNKKVDKNVRLKNSNGNAYGTHKFGLEGRDFGQYRAWQARNKVKKDDDFIILQNNIQNRINKPVESRKIIANKRSQILWEYTSGKITKAEFNRLNGELDRAEKDVASINDATRASR